MIRLIESRLNACLLLPFAARTARRVVGLIILCGLAAPCLASGGGSAVMAAEPEDGPLSFEFTAAYDSKYLFRGVDYGDHLVWMQLDINLELADGLTFTYGTWAASADAGDYGEIDYIGTLSYETGRFGISLMGNGYTFKGDAPSAFELGTTLEVDLDPLPLSLACTYFYDFEARGHYLFTGLTSEHEFNDWLGIELAAGVSYIIDYYVDGSGWNNVDLRLTLPLQLTRTASLNPYIAASLPLGVQDGVERSHLYGGIALVVSF